MAEFLTTKGVSYQLEKLIIEAKKELFLISPYLQISKLFFERLSDSNNKGVKIHIVYGKSELTPHQMGLIQSLKNVSLSYMDNLHAKSYSNENTLIITSMNFYQFSESNNREMGILIEKEKDFSLFESALTEIKSILTSSITVVNEPAGAALKSINILGIKHKNDIAFCICCSESIPFNLNKPLCKVCYSFVMNGVDECTVCHACNSLTKSALDKPLCYSCFKHLDV